MPKRKDISSVLIIGAGPIIIGQACEFDYSGAQACKALKEEGFRVILVNSNPATIMTDPLLADATYIEPIHWKSVEKIIEKEKPDAILPTMGGQTALNTALTLDKKGILKKHNVFLCFSRKDGRSLKGFGFVPEVPACVLTLGFTGLEEGRSFPEGIWVRSRRSCLRCDSRVESRQGISVI